ncbi:MAG: hypothetical protein WD972_02555 [Candidatus Andersenbacteria bacterium]
MRGNDTTLAHILAALRSVGGYFTFRDSDGEEYVIMNRQEFAAAHKPDPSEVQLTLESVEPRPTPIPSTDELLERINRDIALFRSQLDEEASEIAIEITDESNETDDDQRLMESSYPPPRRVRFEPIRGDLPPELQE